MKTIAASLLACSTLASCSAVKASQKVGVEVSDVASCETVSCFYSAQTAQLMSRSELNEGYDHYRFAFQRRQGSILRGIGYGVAGVYTLGLSEVITNPAEGAVQNDKMFVADALCLRTSEVCDTLIITQYGQEPAAVRGDPQKFVELRGASAQD